MGDEGPTRNTRARLEELRQTHEGEDWNEEGEDWNEECQTAVERWFIAQSFGVEVKPSRKGQQRRGKK